MGAAGQPPAAFPFWGSDAGASAHPPGRSAAGGGAGAATIASCMNASPTAERRCASSRCYGIVGARPDAAGSRHLPRGGAAASRVFAIAPARGAPAHARGSTHEDAAAPGRRIAADARACQALNGFAEEVMASARPPGETTAAAGRSRIMPNADLGARAIDTNVPAVIE